MDDAQSALFQRCLDFHGHRCPGVAIGYRTAQLAMELLCSGRSEDEELIAVVENDSCAVDAVQVITGCTFGKGNLIFKDYGKQALTLADRTSGKAVRVAMRNDALPTYPERQAVLEKVQAGAASPDEIKLLEEIQRRRASDILEIDAERLFRVERLDIEFPDKARIMKSEPCARCGEPTMVSRLEESPEGLLCRACRDMKHE